MMGNYVSLCKLQEIFHIRVEGRENCAQAPICDFLNSAPQNT